MVREAKVSEKIIEIAKLLNAKNYLAAGDGNISYRLSEQNILVTPRGRNKAFLEPASLCVATIEGQALKGEPSTELAMHLAVYRAQAAARCVIHAHPPHAIAWTLVHPEATELPTESLPEVILGVGKIPISRYERPGTAALAERIGHAARESRAIIMARHGAVSWGESLEEALNGLERLEHAAMVLMTAQECGTIVPLASDEIAWLRAKRHEQTQRSL